MTKLAINSLVVLFLAVCPAWAALNIDVGTHWLTPAIHRIK